MRSSGWIIRRMIPVGWNASCNTSRPKLLHLTPRAQRPPSTAWHFMLFSAAFASLVLKDWLLGQPGSGLDFRPLNALSCATCPSAPVTAPTTLNQQSLARRPKPSAFHSRGEAFIETLVLGTGLEPARLTAHAPQTCVSTNSTTRAFPPLERGER